MITPKIEKLHKFIDSLNNLDQLTMVKNLR